MIQVLVSLCHPVITLILTGIPMFLQRLLTQSPLGDAQKRWFAVAVWDDSLGKSLKPCYCTLV